MTTPLRPSKAVALFLLILGLAFAGRAFADDQNMTCDNSAPSTHAQLAAGDQNTATHLELSRKLASGAGVTLDVCSADMTVKGGGDDLRVSVEIENPASQHTAGDYLQTLSINPDKAEVRLHLPRSLRARVVVEIPARTPTLEVNLVRGVLTFDSQHLGGAREVNVVDGHVDFLGDADTYENMELNVVVGSFHDHRKRQDGHGMLLSRSFSGTGKGAIEINVVKGSVDLRALE